MSFMVLLSKMPPSAGAAVCGIVKILFNACHFVVR